MFTGIVQAIGTVRETTTAARRGPGAAAHRLTIDLGALADGLLTGASVAVDGVCLTIAALAGTAATFDAIPETWRRTTLRQLAVGSRVNLERALRAGEPLDGHFVQGHVDGIGVLERIERGHGEWKLWVRVDAGLLPAITSQGSIALDGTSLTVVEVEPPTFSVALIPTTLARTTLAERVPGDELNVETDILARLVIQRLTTLLGDGALPAAIGVSWDKLRAGGFV